MHVNKWLLIRYWPSVLALFPRFGITQCNTYITTNCFLLQFIDAGIVTGIEANHKQIEKGTKGMEVCVKIEPIPGEAPKMYGRHFDYTDLLISKVS